MGGTREVPEEVPNVQFETMDDGNDHFEDYFLKC
jgi:hypothetical protein